MVQEFKFLLIDDDEVDRMAIRRALKSAGLKADIVEAGEGKLAIETLNQETFDCVFLDYLIPGMDGLEILQKIRTSGNFVPIIMLTGHGDEELVVKLIQAGASDYVPKARLSADVLSRSVRNVMRVSQAERERRQAEQELQQSKEKIVDILESISDAFFAVDQEGCFTYVNQQAEQLLEEPRASLIGNAVWDKLPESAYWLRDNLRRAIKSDLTVKVEGYFEPTERWLESQIYPRQDGLSVYFRDITERKQAEERLNYLANHDVLTDLPNRAMLMDRLGQAMSRVPWNKRIVAVMFCDLDRFKIINDTLGHMIGDGLLKVVAERLSRCARDGDTVSRLGGDEFVVVLADVAQVDDVRRVAERALEDLFQPYYIEGQELVISASIGISLFPNDGHDASTILQNADIAMYRAKELGRNGYEMYSPVMQVHPNNHLTLEKDLRHALQRDELRLLYQPIMDLSSGEIIGSEALIRWEYGELGLLAPNDFLPIAEENGLIIEIGEWVLHTACAQNMAWQNIGLASLSVAVNLSNRQFRQGDLLNVIPRVLNETGMAPGQLDLELTESIVMKDAAGAIETLHELRDMGVRLSIDDFGTGYSSLAYLKRFPLNTLKIDRSFIKDINTDPDDTAIVGAIVAMAQKLGMETIAEGVETEEQQALIFEHGCDNVQGYLISRPIPAEEFTCFIQQHSKLTRKINLRQ